MRTIDVTFLSKPLLPELAINNLGNVFRCSLATRDGTFVGHTDRIPVESLTSGQLRYIISEFSLMFLFRFLESPTRLYLLSTCII